ncbi:hypothetical protein D9M72_566420 [compost metagenome]
MSKSFGTSSVPTSVMREMSLRSRSTIMRFSACVFSSARIAAMISASSSAEAPRFAVPFIGCVSIHLSASTRKKSSGERETRIGPSSATRAPYLTG